MEEKIHLWAARFYFEIAEKAHRDYQQEQDSDKKVAWRAVAAQNYFYAAVNWIESVFARNKEHSFSHENRMSKILENRPWFSEEVIGPYTEVERSQRNRVTYRGENGQKYENIKKLAVLLQEKYGQQIF